MLPFLQQYSPLIAVLRAMDERKHVDMVAAYQNLVSAMIRKDLADISDHLRTSRVVKRTGEEKSFRRLSSWTSNQLIESSVCVLDECGKWNREWFADEWPSKIHLSSGI